MGSRSAAAALLLLLIAGCASPTLSRFRQSLAAQDSATAALSQWCKAQALASDPTIRAELIRDNATSAPADLGALLAAQSRPGYRHVRLSCGGKVLSEAHNWFVRERLTPEMNHALDQTDTPFGTVAAPLRFTRERLGEAKGAAFGCPRGTVLSHRARLHTPDGQPLALVVECYTHANLSTAQD